MLFNSYLFIFVFLPATLLVFYQLGAHKQYRAALFWLVIASLFFYGWWNPAYLFLLLGSIGFNFLMGRALSPGPGRAQPQGRRILLFLSVATNLSAIGYFKYANFFVDNTSALLGVHWQLSAIALPLAISFFTFQQITFLVDSYKGQAEEHSFLRYCLFVTFFPQLIAGPIVHHKEMLPQFSHPKVFHFNHQCLAVGLTIFVIGLFKKVVVADGVARYSTPVFDAALSGTEPTFFEAWGAALAYTFQLYFDFSGYSDMAVGLAYMFGIRLALNFFSPYKAVNIIDFWRRWNMTLSRFLRDYIYIPLGGSRHGLNQRYRNLLITMLLGGLWHGAGWTFVIWGALHGFYLLVNHLWRYLRTLLGHDLDRTTWYGRFASRTLTLLAVVCGWVLFRSESFPAAMRMLQGMAGANGFALPEPYLQHLNRLASAGDWLASLGMQFHTGVTFFGGPVQWLILFALLIFCWHAPNTYQFLGNASPVIGAYDGEPKGATETRASWAPNKRYAGLLFFLFVVAVFSLDATSEFLYFQF
jgi:alginate O-acetyltransferase complex protein AlgI